MGAPKWTLVQHSGFGYSYKPAFKRAVETTSVSTEKEQKKVEKVGGVLFETYREAAAQEQQENYPPEVKGMIPRCRGSFARIKLGGLRVYTPKKEV
jgi:hypothetical protein